MKYGNWTGKDSISQHALALGNLCLTDQGLIGGEVGSFLPYLYSLTEAFQGINVQPFLAGLQAGNHLLTLHFSRADGETGQATVEELSKPRFGDFSP